MFLRGNILTDKSVSASLTAYALNDFITEILQILMSVVYCTVIMIKKTLLLNKLSL